MKPEARLTRRQRRAAFESELSAVESRIDDNFAAGLVTREAIDACNAGFQRSADRLLRGEPVSNAERLALAVTFRAIQEVHEHGTSCALCSGRVIHGGGGKLALGLGGIDDHGSAVVCVRTYCARCFVGVQKQQNPRELAPAGFAIERGEQEIEQ